DDLQLAQRLERIPAKLGATLTPTRASDGPDDAAVCAAQRWRGGSSRKPAKLSKSDAVKPPISSVLVARRAGGSAVRRAFPPRLCAAVAPDRPRTPSSQRTFHLPNRAP